MKRIYLSSKSVNYVCMYKNNHNHNINNIKIEYSLIRDDDLNPCKINRRKTVKSLDS